MVLVCCCSAIVVAVVLVTITSGAKLTSIPGFEIGFFGNPISFGGAPMAKRLREFLSFSLYRALTCREADRRRTLP
jgi:hypothetical protein